MNIKTALLELADFLAQDHTDSPAAIALAVEYIEQLEKEHDELEEKVEILQTRRDRAYDDMLNWRGIEREAGDEPCRACSGSGVKVYGSSSTWRGGIGGCVITSDICDSCWGSGNAAKPWLNLRQKSQESK